MLSPKFCSELTSYGINQSGYYYIDVDGPKNGLPPKSVFCNFEKIIFNRSKLNCLGRLIMLRAIDFQLNFWLRLVFHCQLQFSLK